VHDKVTDRVQSDTSSITPVKLQTESKLILIFFVYISWSCYCPVDSFNRLNINLNLLPLSCPQ